MNFYTLGNGVDTMLKTIEATIVGKTKKRAFTNYKQRARKRLFKAIEEAENVSDHDTQN